MRKEVPKPTQPKKPVKLDENGEEILENRAMGDMGDMDDMEGYGEEDEGSGWEDENGELIEEKDPDKDFV